MLSNLSRNQGVFSPNKAFQSNIRLNEFYKNKLPSPPKHSVSFGSQDEIPPETSPLKIPQALLQRISYLVRTGGLSHLGGIPGEIRTGKMNDKEVIWIDLYDSKDTEAYSGFILERATGKLIGVTKNYLSRPQGTLNPQEVVNTLQAFVSQIIAQWNAQIAEPQTPELVKLIDRNGRFFSITQRLPFTD
ncbi:MAG: hypothetical protein K2X66_13345 [Cyanobacteria bacterium]|nr:hypothetical protein [Cyanobacteriota bacterium]